MGRVDSNKDAICNFYSYALILQLLCSAPVLCVAQERPQEVRTPALATLTVARVQVPDVRGRRPEEAEAILRRAGLQPGTSTTKPLPGVAGTVGEQDPAANSVVARGSRFNLAVVASKAGQNSDGDGE